MKKRPTTRPDGLIAERRHELHPDGKPIRGPVKRRRRCAPKHSFRPLEQNAGLGVGNDPDGLAARYFVELGRGFLEMVAETLAQLCRLGHRVDAFRIDIVEVPRLCGKGDSKPSWVGPDLVMIGALLRRRPIGVSDLRTGGRVEQRCAVAHRTCEACAMASPLQSSPKSGPAGLRARVGFRPNNPQHDAGIRIEPPPSLP